MTPKQFYDLFIKALVIAGAACLLFTTVAIIIDVAMRNLGYRSLQATSALVEYALLVSTMAVAPYLVRTNGHVAVQSFVEQMPNKLRDIVSGAALVLSIGILGLVSWRAGVVALEVHANGAIDMRSINIPGWVPYVALSAGFGLMAIEFLIILLRGERFQGAQGEG